MLNRVSSYLFLGSLFGVVFVWGYWPTAWAMSWPQLTLLGLSLVGLVSWIVFSLDQLRLWLKKRSTRFGISLAITAMMSIGILGAVNYLATVYNIKKDFTQNQLHTLSDQTKKILSGLSEDITIRVWSTGVERMSANIDMKRFLENYRLAAKGKLTVEIKNPNEDRLGSSKDNVRRDNIIVVKAASGRESRIETFTDNKGEEQLTNAIIQAIKGHRRTVCFLGGQGELSIEETGERGLSTVKQAMAQGFYDAKEVRLSDAEKIPAECEALVIVGPTGAPIERDLKILKGYLGEGGKVLALFGPGTPEAWRKLPADFGVTVRQDLIVDPRFPEKIAFLTRNYANDVDVVRDFKSEVLFLEASSLQIDTKLQQEGLTVKPFISTERFAYAKAGDLKSIKNAAPAPSDLKGPLAIAAVIRKDIKKEAATEAPPKQDTKGKKGAWNFSLINEAKAQDVDGDHDHEAPAAGAKDGPKDQKNEMHLIVFGNHMFAANAIVGAYGNKDLFMNALSSLMKDQDTIGIRPRELRQASLEITAERFRKVLATVLILAGAFIVGGIRAGRRRSDFASA